jgi:hypothetical protein
VNGWVGGSKLWQGIMVIIVISLLVLMIVLVTFSGLQPQGLFSFAPVSPIHMQSLLLLIKHVRVPISPMDHRLRQVMYFIHCEVLFD